MVRIFGFAEMNYHWTQITTKACQVIAKTACQNLNIQTSSCKGWQGGRYQPGGTCTGAIDTWASRIVEKEEDPIRLGRWSSIKIQIKGIEIVFITAYRPCKSQINTKVITSYAQQWRELVGEKIRVDPRSKMLEDLKKQSRQRERKE